MLEKARQCGIIPVIKINEAEKAVPLAKALLAGGVNFIEITFRTAAAPEAIKVVAEQVPEMIVGAGTIITLEQYHKAIESGAKFIVSPGLPEPVVKQAVADGVPIFPGTVTPTEIIRGIELGLTTFKFFPAENYGGLTTIKALAAPFGNITFIPTGGISEKNANDYWAFNKIVAVGGSWMAPENLINEENWDEITKRTAQAVAQMNEVRGK